MAVARVRYPLTGTLDSTGTGNVVSPQFTQWSSLNVACQTQNSYNAHWTIYTSASIPPSLSNTVDFGVGGSFRGGPYLVAPNEYVIVEVTNANANDTVLGAISGLDGISLDQLLNVGPSGGGNAVVGTISAEVANTVNVAGNVGVSGTVGTTDAGLAGSIASALSVMSPYGSYPLTSNGTTTISVGSGGAQGSFPYQVGSWMLQIVGLANASVGVRLLWQGQDGSGHTLYSRQRDSSTAIFGTIVATGDVDAPLIQWQITLPSGAPTNATARLFFSADKVPDQWFDSAIYGPQFTSPQNQALGMDGVLLSVAANLAAGKSQSYPLPTYRGLAQIGVFASTTGHFYMIESTYTGTAIRTNKNFPINSGSGPGTQYFQFKLMGLYNQIVLVNDSPSSGNQFYAQVDAINDLI